MACCYISSFCGTAYTARKKDMRALDNCAEEHII